MARTINIPKFLHEIHGTKPTIANLLMTYGAGLFVGIISGIFFYDSGLEVWEAILVGILFYDVAGGVVSNLTSSTNRHYQRSKRQRVNFLVLHLLHPLLLALILNEYWVYFIFIALFTVISGFIVNAANTRDLQQTVAGALTTVGVAALALFNVNPVILYAFGALFMVKILLGFAVRRSD